MLRLAESGHLIVVAVISAGLGLAVGTLLASLHRLTRQRYLHYWALAWYVMSARGAVGAAGLLLGIEELPGRAVGLLAIYGGYLQVPALGLAAASLRTGQPAPIVRRGLLGAPSPWRRRSCCWRRSCPCPTPSASSLRWFPSTR